MYNEDCIEILELCELFDNKTKNKLKKVEQVQKLLALVELVAKQHNGGDYADERNKDDARAATS
ncbi:unnamed protein product [Arabidopsis thaliana]|uniref:AIG1-type G domain-containing protein n=1 Tax=Arabidopsis thaliana TaxID=3702 RepID=A0A5S9XHJ0_ARATH|nr:unnamed protein product [Arabidopsis thaliana]